VNLAALLPSVSEGQVLALLGNFSGNHTAAARQCFNNMSSGLMHIDSLDDLLAIEAVLNEQYGCVDGDIPVANNIL
jgi:hypothetical protein